jgi:acetyl-CoA carboxylase biotin carboxyl carrier protein
MDHKAIEKVLKMFEQSLVASMELETDTFKIKLSKFSEASPAQVLVSNPHMVAASPSVQSTSNTEPRVPDAWWVNSPLVGTFYTSSTPEAKPYVQVGQKVQEGQIVCLIEAMKVMNEIKAHRSGIVTDIKAENGKLVEYNQALICIGDV